MTAQQQPTIKPIPKKRRWFFLMLLSSIILIILSGYLGLNLLTTKLDAVAAKTETAFMTIKELQIKNEQLQHDLQALQDLTKKATITTVKYWKPLVIEHLVHLASVTLNTTQDLKLALAFLFTAQQYATDPELAAINYALNHDIAKLQVIPLVDATAVILTLEAINQKLSSLPLVASQLPTQAPKLGEEGTSHLKTWWQKLVTNTLTALKGVVTIRYRTLDPLLQPDQETILRLTIKTKLLEAQFAVMHNHQKLYQASLAQLISMTTRYFSANQHIADITASLQELQEVELQPKLPLPLETLTAITNFISAHKLSQEQVPLPQNVPRNKEEQAP